jgi:hypothetical protein
MNYSALGEYTALYRQARDAAGRRFALANNLGNRLLRGAERPGEPLDLAACRRDLDEIEAADRELEVAVKRANEAAALCGEPSISAALLLARA